MPVLAIYVPNTPVGRQNLDHAIATRRWGFRKHESAYDFIAPRTTVLIATGYHHPTQGGSPRKQLEDYAAGFIDRIYVFRSETPIRTETSPHWPDEFSDETVKYPERFTVTPLYELKGLDLSAVPLALADAFRLSALKQGSGEPVPDSEYTRALERGRPAVGDPREDDSTSSVGAQLVAMSSERIQFFAAQAEAHAELALWRPLSKQGSALLVGPGEPFMFGEMLASGSAVQVRGGGVLSGVSRMFLTEMWEWFGEESGASSLTQLRQQYAAVTGGLDDGDDPEVEAILIYDVRFFAPSEYLEVPVDPVGFVLERGAYFELDGRTDTDPIVRAVLTYVQPAPSTSQDEVTQAVLTKIRGQAKAVVARIGQGAFKAMVSEAYKHHCALTGDKVRPVLEAAHIKSFASGGEYRLDNGILLRSDMHTLYDRGYISFDVDARLMVSPQLRQRFGNGDWLYARVGQAITVPERAVDRPNPDFLTWHHERVFLPA